jgi:hypothetical protein
MLGGRKKRVAKLSAGAEANLEDGESIAGPHVLVATDRNLYAMKLSGRRLLDVGEVAVKAPLDKADLYQGKKALTFGGVKFHVMALFGEHADRLYDYVKRSGGAAESKPAPAEPAGSEREQRIREALDD